MKLKFKHQKFQADASAAICDIFAGQPKIERQKYRKDIGVEREEDKQISFDTTDGTTYSKYQVSETGYNNALLQISDTQILDNVKRIQRNSNNIAPSNELKKAIVEIKDEKTKKKSKVTMKCAKCCYP